MPQGAGADKKKEYRQCGPDDNDKPPYGDENKIEEGVQCYMCDTEPFTSWATLYNHLFKMHGLRAAHYKGQWFHAKVKELRNLKEVKTWREKPEVKAKAKLKSKADVEQAESPPPHPMRLRHLSRKRIYSEL